MFRRRMLLVPFTFTLISLIFSSCSSYRLVGKVVDLELNEVSNARISVKYLDNSDSLSAVTQADGSFNIGGINEPNIRIEVSAKNYQRKSQPILFKNKEEFKQIQLEFRPTRILGQVFDSKTKRTLQNVIIKILPNMTSIITDNNGKFIIEDGLDPDLTNTLQFTKTNYNVNTKMVQPELYRDYDLGNIYLTAIISQVATASGSTEMLNMSDIAVTNTVHNIPIDENTKIFLEERESFSRDEFASKMRETNSGITDKSIMDNLNGLIELGKITVDEKGIYHTKKQKNEFGY